MLMGMLPAFSSVVILAWDDFQRPPQAVKGAGVQAFPLAEMRNERDLLARAEVGGLGKELHPAAIIG